MLSIEETRDRTLVEEAGKIQESDSPKIILAHGSCRVRRIVRNICRAIGQDTVEATSGAEVVGLLATWMTGGRGRPSLIIAGARLRGFGGLELLDGLNGTEWETPLVLLIPREDHRTKKDALRRGACAVLGWPLLDDDVRDLRRLIASGVDTGQHLPTHDGAGLRS